MLYFKTSLLVGLGTLSILVASVPTSVLIRDTQLNNNLKAKRSAPSEIPPPSPSNAEPKDEHKSYEVPLKGFEPARKSSPKKRGISNPLQYDDLYLPNRNEEPLYLPGIFHAPVDFQQDRLDLEELPLAFS
uniref:Uncharacterized protein n=1 Tax=Megaselia scalaris TaxID=36166 RepID=T1GEL0_MEGSC